MLNGVKQLAKRYSNRPAVTTGEILRSTKEHKKTQQPQATETPIK